MDYVVKIGGSLLDHPEELRRLCATLGGLATEVEFLVVPGGGLFADAVREAYRTLGISDRAAHEMALLAMDQYGLLLADITPGSVTTRDLEGAREARARELLPILLPYSMASKASEIPASWDATSDSVSAYVAKLVGARRLVLVKDVDGIFDKDPKVDPSAVLLERIKASELLEMECGCVDRLLPELLISWGIVCYVVSGLHPDRVERVLREEGATATIVEPY